MPYTSADFIPIDTGASPTGAVKAWVKVALVAGTGILSWQNPVSGTIFVTDLLINATTPTSGACTADGGTTATTSTTTSDNLIDGLSLATAGAFSNLLNPGTNGKAMQKLASGKWVTITVASGTVTGLVGYAYIGYVVA